MIEIQGKFAKAAFDDNHCYITNYNQHENQAQTITKVEVLVFEDTFSARPKQVSSSIVLVNDVHETLVTGDVAAVPYKLKYNMGAEDEFKNGVETRVVIHRDGKDPAEQFVIGYTPDDWTYRIRYDDAKRTGVLNSPPAMLAALLMKQTQVHVSPEAEKKHRKSLNEDHQTMKQMYKVAVQEASQEWQSLPNFIMN